MSQELDQHVIELFNSNIDMTMQTLDHLAPTIADSSMLLVQALLSENKILCCGDGQSGALAQIFTSNLLNRFDYERPGLPAIALSTDATTITAVSSDGSFSEIFAKQIRALGQAGDILLVLANSSNPAATLQAMQAAHDREMIIIVINNDYSSDISALISPEDIELTIPSSNRARVAESQLLILNCFCELIDRQLFGGES